MNVFKVKLSQVTQASQVSQLLVPVAGENQEAVIDKCWFQVTLGNGVMQSIFDM